MGKICRILKVVDVHMYIHMHGSLNKTFLVLQIQVAMWYPHVYSQVGASYFHCFTLIMVFNIFLVQ